MLNVYLDIFVEGEVADRWGPCQAIGVVARVVFGDAQGVGSGLLELRVGCQVVVRVVDACEHHLGVVAEVGAEVDVTSVIVARRRVRVQVVKVVGGAALLTRMLVVKVESHPDGHVAALGSGALKDDVCVVLMRDDLVDRL